jgi:ABC-type transport system involved in multi-copper enzyme maturation permease subunit
LTNYNLRDTEGQLYFGNRPKLTKKPTPLSIFALGLDPNMGRLLIIWESQPQNQPGGQIFDPGEKNYLLSLFRVPDFSYLVTIVLSLLALFFAFDSICGEKERGTLRLMLANSVSRGEVLLSKWFGGYVSFLLCVLPGLTLMFLVVTLLPMVSMDGEDWLRIGVILALTFIYLSLFFLLGLFISTRTHSAETSLILILLVWLIWVIGAPSISPLIAKRIHPTPAISVIMEQKYHVSQGKSQKLQAMLKAGVEKPLAQKEVNRWANEQFWKLNDDAIRMVRNQAALTQTLTRISPLGSFVAAATTMARTGVEDTHRYKAYVIHWDKARREQEGSALRDSENRKMPFAPTEITFEDGFRTITVDLVLLILFNFVFFMGAYLSFLRYDVR